MSNIDADWYDMRFRKNPNHCRSQWYVKRNVELLTMVYDERFTNVFEFAGASGLLMEMMLRWHPEIQHYTMCDIANAAVELAKNHVNRDDLDYWCMSASEACAHISWEDIDLVVSTSIEHMEVEEVCRVLWNAKPGTRVLFSLGRKKRKCGSHIHPYPEIKDVISVYNPLVTIKQIKEFDDRHILMYGVRRETKF